MSALQKIPALQRSHIEANLSKDYNQHSVWVDEFTHQATRVLDGRLLPVLQVFQENLLTMSDRVEQLVKKERGKLDEKEAKNIVKEEIKQAIRTAFQQYLQANYNLASMSGREITALRDKLEKQLQRALLITMKSLLGYSEHIVDEKRKRLYTILNSSGTKNEDLRSIVQENDTIALEENRKRFSEDMHTNKNNPWYIFSQWVGRLLIVINAEITQPSFMQRVKNILARKK